jgi:hypothetical protein
VREASDMKVYESFRAKRSPFELLSATDQIPF